LIIDSVKYGYAYGGGICIAATPDYNIWTDTAVTNDGPYFYRIKLE